MPFYQRNGPGVGVLPARIMRGVGDIVAEAAVPGWLAAPHRVPAIQALVAGTASYGDVPAGITGRSIALHIFSGSIHGIHTGFGTGGIITGSSL